jgi:hypothetical protein
MKTPGQKKTPPDLLDGSTLCLLQVTRPSGWQRCLIEALRWASER